MLTLTSKHSVSVDPFERKFQANISSSEQSLEKSEEEFIPIKKSIRDKLHSGFDKPLSKMKAMNEHILAMLEKLHDKYDKKVRKTATAHVSPNLKPFTQIE